jgi:hypothetical protein
MKFCCSFRPNPQQNLAKCVILKKESSLVAFLLWMTNLLNPDLNVSRFLKPFLEYFRKIDGEELILADE